MILLLDIGNSRTKWAVLGPGGLGSAGARSHGGGIEALPGDIPISPDQVYASNVAGPRMEEALRAAVRSRWACPLTFARPAAALGKVRNGYAEPQQLGVDRWLAILAAYDRQQGAVCVVDAGTATTVDMVKADGRHLGGFILPGVNLMAESLLDATGDLGRVRDKAAGNPSLEPGTSTGAAIRDGAWAATVGLVERARALLPRRAGLAVTGGLGATLAGFLGVDYHEHLVLEGLALNWRAGAAAG
ncbi:MAG: type III pantothenate kinase [Chromatiales bacterium]|nr:MAG: type III pantothenate kinase [Chromatiales bacterium]